jgi:hypothetical protein
MSTPTALYLQDAHPIAPNPSFDIIGKTQRKGNKIGPKLYNEIANRKDAATIVQLRTGHCGLNHYLHRFGQTGSPYCECGYGRGDSGTLPAGM